MNNRLVPRFSVLSRRALQKNWRSKHPRKSGAAVSGENDDEQRDPSQQHDRLMPRTEALPIYTTEEFNDKVRVLRVLRAMLTSRRSPVNAYRGRKTLTGEDTPPASALTRNDTV